MLSHHISFIDRGFSHIGQHDSDIEKERWNPVLFLDCFALCIDHNENQIQWNVPAVGRVRHLAQSYHQHWNLADFMAGQTRPIVLRSVFSQLNPKTLRKSLLRIHQSSERTQRKLINRCNWRIHSGPSRVLLLCHQSLRSWRKLRDLGSHDVGPRW